MDWLIVGLGNPGQRYQKTRHNAGFLTAEMMVATAGETWKMVPKFDGEIAESKQWLGLKPQTFMNASGESVGKVCRFYKILLKQVIVIHDDLDLPLGQTKVSWAKGPHLHNGIASVERELGSPEFWRVRVGVESRSPEERRIISGERFVLRPMDYQEQKELQSGVTKAALAVKDIMEGRYVSSR